jgi:hypothetical protein
LDVAVLDIACPGVSPRPQESEMKLGIKNLSPAKYWG